MRTSAIPYCLFLLLVITYSCSRNDDGLFDAGVSYDLALHRKAIISNIDYALNLNLPPDKNMPINGVMTISFDLNDTKDPLLIDFKADSTGVKYVKMNGDDTSWSLMNEHLVIGKADLYKGRNEVTIGFVAGNMSLNRNDDFLYSLLVPDRARTAFPCFDQPDLKARYQLSLRMDSSWIAISNGSITKDSLSGSSRIIVFSPTKPISSYLFAFAAGRFERIDSVVDGIEMTMLHRETRKELVKENISEIFRLHAMAIKWLEEYTGIPYPFDKFGFVLIPSFQYSGMEHPGSIYYRASSLFLDSDANLNRKMSRAGLIAHETSHIWFGDLVTMKWFDDVWLKEVYAGFMSDKIVNPLFPEENHNLKFLLSRYPAAYAVDRTQGTNPVIQKLDNMKDAGTLYGGIIYNKAPILMRHLEMITGSEALQTGLQEYLLKYSFNNAEWQDLIDILDKKTDTDLQKWSDAWAREPGMPVISCLLEEKQGKTVITVNQQDPFSRGRTWPQKLSVQVVTPDSVYSIETWPTEEDKSIEVPDNTVACLPAFNGIAYGYFVMDLKSIDYYTSHYGTIEDPVTRGVFLLNLRENMLHKRIDSRDVFTKLPEFIRSEKEIQIQAVLRSMLTSIYWNDLNRDERSAQAGETEELLWEMVRSEPDLSNKKSWFNSLVDISLTQSSLKEIYRIWNGDKKMDFFLSENDYTNIACNLALKRFDDGDKILKDQLKRITNTDSRLRFEFIIPSLSPDKAIRNSFFYYLLDEENREHEPWVTDALSYLTHPVNSVDAVNYIIPGLKELPEIQSTGDIFFPGRWAGALLSSQNSEQAFDKVREFLELNPEFPDNLKMKVLQESDHLYRKYSQQN